MATHSEWWYAGSSRQRVLRLLFFVIPGHFPSLLNHSISQKLLEYFLAMYVWWGGR